MLTPAERDRAHRFAMWIRGDQERNEPPVQMTLMEIGATSGPVDTIQAEKEVTERSVNCLGRGNPDGNRSFSV